MCCMYVLYVCAACMCCMYVLYLCYMCCFALSLISACVCVRGRFRFMLCKPASIPRRRNVNGVVIFIMPWISLTLRYQLRERCRCWRRVSTATCLSMWVPRLMSLCDHVNISWAFETPDPSIDHTLSVLAVLFVVGLVNKLCSQQLQVCLRWSLHMLRCGVRACVGVCEKHRPYTVSVGSAVCCW